MRTDDHRNPTAFTTDVAKTAGLVEGIDYERGAPFSVEIGNGQKLVLYTAKLLLNPIETTLRVLDAAGFYTQHGQPRWIYIGIPKFIWDTLDRATKVKTIGFMYSHEGGTAMKSLFP